MNLIEKWKHALQATYNEWDVAEDEEEYEKASIAEGEVQAYEHCIKSLTDACTPRPPQMEWFKMWKHWSMKAQEPNIFGHNAVVTDIPDDEALHAEYVQKVSLCVPVNRDWPHAFAGWHVVEVKSEPN